MIEDKKPDVVWSVTRRDLRWVLLLGLLIAGLLGMPQLRAQKVQDDFSDKLKVTSEGGGVAVTTSADGKYVYVVGSRGVIVSDDHGKTGSWVQTLKLK